MSTECTKSPTGMALKQWRGNTNARKLGLGIGGYGVGLVFRLHRDYLLGVTEGAAR